MKIRFSTYIMLTALFCVQYISAYIFDFSNHTLYPLKVQIHLVGDPGDKWYQTVIPPKTEGQKAQYAFKFGTKWFNWLEAEWHKEWFCLGDIQVATPLLKKKMALGPNGEELGEVEELIMENGQVKFGPWKAVAVTLVKSEGANAIIDAAGELTDGLQSLAKDIAGAAIQYKANK